MEIRFQAHHAVISDRMRDRSERMLRKIAARVPRATDAIVRFAEDGPTRRVEVELHASNRKLTAASSARFFGTALADACQRLLARVQRERRDKNKKHSMRARRESAIA